ncbi:MAG: oxygen-dependent coproporphyrinogen oxidase [Chitinophagales bacterium]|nr:oxygen-dependent coproporphyrinogen oxidase [Chitinophagales bacterium]MBP7533193.1 oxygen-dependent coproporphyrinogen oxidase [Chitinophagales bacterium]
MKDTIVNWFKDLQSRICAGLEELDGSGAVFLHDDWVRAEGGGGKTNTFKDGNLLEKGGVAFSAVHGSLHPKIQQSLRVTVPDAQFLATGVSIVLHPTNPHMPIIHMNVRYFELSDGKWWFGGGIDVTPHYVVPADAKWFHEQLKGICDKHHPSYYERFKKWADDYFYLSHRNETRGIGGIFFDRLGDNEPLNKQQLHDFVKDVGNFFVPAYTYFASQHRNDSYTPQHQDWQLRRRSRYVEFNLLHDQGTKFGLDSNGRTESILLSMPPLAKWDYNFMPAANTPELETLQWLRKEVDWLNVV